MDDDDEDTPGVPLAPPPARDFPRDYVRGKPWQQVVGSRVVVTYEVKEEGERKGLRQPFRGSVLKLLAPEHAAEGSEEAHGLYVRFDNYTPDDDAWVHEEGDDEWVWEEDFQHLQARETMYLVRAPPSVGLHYEHWLPLRHLRPHWVWLSSDEGWTQSDKPFQPELASLEPKDEQLEEDELDREAGDELLTVNEIKAKYKGKKKEDGHATPGSEGEKKSGEGEGDDDDEGGGTGKKGKGKKGKEKEDADYVDDDDKRKKAGDGDDDDDDEAYMPTEVTGWQKLEESPDCLSAGKQLRNYQLDGLNWLRLSFYVSRNVILGDEMGLGKTAQSVSLLQTLRSYEKIDGPFLIVAPLSTLGHWEREIGSWTDMYAVTYQGNADSRRIIIEHDWLAPERRKGEPRYRFHVCLCNFETIVMDPEPLKAVRWRYLIVDEGHRLKNKNSQTLERMKDLRASRKLVLSGTPLQNHIREMWAILNFLEPSKFADEDDFLRRFGSLSSGGGTAEQVNRLNKLLKPHMLRREKADVLKNLPGMKETLLYVEITNMQKLCYRAVLERNRELLLRGAGNAGERGPAFNNVSMMLRHVCNHPWIIKDVEEGALEQLESESERRGPRTPRERTDPEFWQKQLAKTRADDRVRYTERLVQSSGKFVLLDKLLPKLKSDDHRVLIFSQFTKVLDLMEEFFDARAWAFERLDGNLVGSERQKAIDRFSDKASETFIFMLSTRAGGQGINLVSADTVIIFDPDWNPQNDLQAMARCHRIGQTKAVQVYKLCTKGTYEMHMLATANTKLGLEHAVMKTGAHSKQNLTSTGFGKRDILDEEEAGAKRMTIEKLLKSGAQVLNAEQDAEASAFNNSSIEDILAHYSETRELGGDGVAKEGEEEAFSRAKEGGSFFSQASFIAESGSSIDMDDPNFWSKMLPGTAAAANADAVAAARKAGATKLSGAPPQVIKGPAGNVMMAPPPPKRPALKEPSADGEGGKGGAAPPSKRAKQPTWARVELLRVERLLLAFGHKRAHDSADGTTAADDAAERGPTALKRALDYLLLIWLRRADPRLVSQWRPFKLHTYVDSVVETMRKSRQALNKKKEEAKEDGPKHSVADLVAAAGGHQRPRGRAPNNDQGVALTWAYLRDKWVDCSGGLIKGRSADQKEVAEVTKENAEFEKRMAELAKLDVLPGQEEEDDGEGAPEEGDAAAEAAEPPPAAAAAASSPAPPKPPLPYVLPAGTSEAEAAEAEAARDLALEKALGTLQNKLAAKVLTESSVTRWLAERGTRHATAFLRRALGLRALEEAVKGDHALRLVPSVTPAPTYGGWGVDCDRALLLGVYRHGLGNWAAIQSDAQLKFPAPDLDDATTKQIDAPPTPPPPPGSVAPYVSASCAASGGPTTVGDAMAVSAEVGTAAADAAAPADAEEKPKASKGARGESSKASKREAPDDDDEDYAPAGKRPRKRTASVGRWTDKEEKLLREAVAALGTRNWAGVAEWLVTGRSAAGVQQHWEIMQGKRKRDGAKKGGKDDGDEGEQEEEVKKEETEEPPADGRRASRSRARSPTQADKTTPTKVSGRSSGRSTPVQPAVEEKEEQRPSEAEQKKAAAKRGKGKEKNEVKEEEEKEEEQEDEDEEEEEEEAEDERDGEEEEEEEEEKEEEEEEKEEEEEEHEVERIVKERRRSGRVEYLVKWKAGDSTWEPSENLEGTEAIDAYMSSSSSKAKSPPGRGSPASAASSSSCSSAAASASAKGKGGARALWPADLLTLRASQLIDAMRDEGWIAAAQEAAREAKHKRRTSSGSKATKGTCDSGDLAPDEFADADAALKSKWCTWVRDDGKGVDAARLWLAKPLAAPNAASPASPEAAAGPTSPARDSPEVDYSSESMAADE